MLWFEVWTELLLEGLEVEIAVGKYLEPLPV